MTKKRSSKKKTDAVETVKRFRPEKKESKVNGTTNFENGKLVLPEKTTEQEITAFVAKKEKLSAEKKVDKPKKQKKVDIPDEPDSKWEEYITLNNCKSQSKREEIKKMITAGLALKDVTWSKVGGDFVLKKSNRVILHICSLSKVSEFSAMCPALGKGMKRYTMEEVLKALPKSYDLVKSVKPKVSAKKVETPKSKGQLSGKEMVSILEAKVKSTSHSSKGFIKPPAVKLTDPAVKAFIKQNGYSTTGNTILLNRV